ncbi:MAG: energy transducer TonB [Gemmatimonadaceae bacterium]
MQNRRISPSLFACLLAAAFLPAWPVLAGAQAGMPAGTVNGVITAKGANGATVKGANVLVQLWTTDATTEAKRDTACAMWLANKTVWMQAKGEAESPSGVNWTGTAVGNDLQALNSLLALRRDTVRADANGEFSFASVPFGAYTIEAEMFANDKFLQWSKDAAVIPNTTTRVQLDASTLAENQYCPVSSGSSTSANGEKVYELSDLDKPVAVVSGGAASLAPSTPNSFTLSVVVDPNGAPVMNTVTVKSTTGSPVTDRDAMGVVRNLKFSKPMVSGNAVSARIDYIAAIPAAGGGRRRR